MKPKDVFVNQELDFGSIEWVRRSALRFYDGDSCTTLTRARSFMPPAPRASLQVAYDYDFTIAHYNVSLGHTIYELAKQHLARQRAQGSRGAPTDCPRLACRSLRDNIPSRSARYSMTQTLRCAWHGRVVALADCA